MNKTQLLNTFSEYCDSLIKERRPVKSPSAKGLSAIKHLQDVTSLVTTLQQEMTNKANQLIAEFDGSTDELHDELSQIATSKLQSFISG